MELERSSLEIALSEYRKEYQNLAVFHAFCHRCPNYGQQWVCPPFDFDVNEILDRYSRVRLFGYKLILPDELTVRPLSKEMRKEIGSGCLTSVRSIIDPEIMDLEESMPGSRAFYAGSCHLCDPLKCTRISDPVMPCRFPDKARNSLENFGFDLGRTAEELLGTPLLWEKEGKLPPYFFFIAALMY